MKVALSSPHNAVNRNEANRKKRRLRHNTARLTYFSSNLFHWCEGLINAGMFIQTPPRCTCAGKFIRGTSPSLAVNHHQSAETLSNCISESHKMSNALVFPLLLTGEGVLPFINGIMWPNLIACNLFTFILGCRYERERGRERLSPAVLWPCSDAASVNEPCCEPIINLHPTSCLSDRSPSCTVTTQRGTLGPGGKGSSPRGVHYSDSPEV